METSNAAPIQSHNHHLFSQMIKMLIASGLGEKEYGFDVSKNRYAKLRYEDIALVMNRQGFTTSTGKAITGTTLKVLVHRIRNKEQGTDWWRQQTPDWKIFSLPREQQHHKTSPTNSCLVCGIDLKPSSKPLCSADCFTFYHQHKHAPHHPNFPTIFPQMKYEEQFYEERH